MCLLFDIINFLYIYQFATAFQSISDRVERFIEIMFFRKTRIASKFVLYSLMYQYPHLAHFFRKCKLSSCGLSYCCALQPFATWQVSILTWNGLICSRVLLRVLIAPSQVSKSYHLIAGTFLAARLTQTNKTTQINKNYDNLFVSLFIGGFEKAAVIAQHLIDYYIPFLPLEQSHVEKCALSEFRLHGVYQPTEEMMA